MYLLYFGFILVQGIFEVFEVKIGEIEADAHLAGLSGFNYFIFCLRRNLAESWS